MDLVGKAGIFVAVFAACVLVLGFSRSRGVRQTLLLVGSYGVYVAWSGWFAALLMGATVMNFQLGKWVRRTQSRFALAMGILANVAVLATFKYLPEAAPALPFASLSKWAHLALPLGISFWTFQAISYLFDLYREEELDPTLVEFGLYMAFFPVVISGPVCRMPEMLPQFRSDRQTSGSEIRGGLLRIAIGALMMLLAKLLGQGIFSGDGITSGFDRATAWGGTDVWCLALGYGLQLFFDFAGYSHIAIGAAQALGISVPENFARPFASTSPSMFWTRWHMSLSFWIRDYVFLPLAVLRREMWWRNAALVIAMVVFGAWHKATLLFVLWGAYHGVLLVLHRQVQALQRRFDWDPGEGLWTPLSWATTIALISLGWIFFRANSPAQAWQMFAAVLSPGTYSVHQLSGSLYALVLALALGYTVVMMVGDRLQGQPMSTALISDRWLWLPALYIVALLLVLGMTYTRGADAAQFMYRNF